MKNLGKTLAALLVAMMSLFAVPAATAANECGTADASLSRLGEDDSEAVGQNAVRSYRISGILAGDRLHVWALNSDTPAEAQVTIKRDDSTNSECDLVVPPASGAPLFLPPSAVEDVPTFRFDTDGTYVIYVTHANLPSQTDDFDFGIKTTAP